MTPEFAKLSNRTAVIGVGHTAYGNFPLEDEYSLAAKAFRNAVEDCGIDKNEIDGMLVCRIPYYARMGEVLGLNPRWTLTLPGHGRMSAMGIIEAATAIAAGHATRRDQRRIDAARSAALRMRASSRAAGASFEACRYNRSNASMSSFIAMPATPRAVSWLSSHRRV